VTWGKKGGGTRKETRRPFPWTLLQRRKKQPVSDGARGLHSNTQFRKRGEKGVEEGKSHGAIKGRRGKKIGVSRRNWKAGS